MSKSLEAITTLIDTINLVHSDLKKVEKENHRLREIIYNQSSRIFKVEKENQELREKLKEVLGNDE